MTTDLESLLSTPLDSFVETKLTLLPEGTYHGTIISYQMGESPVKKTPYVEFTAIPTAPGPDVDTESLTGVDLSKWKLNEKFYVTEKSMFRLKGFLKSLGFDISNASTSELLPQAIGGSVILSAKHVLSDRVKDDAGNFKTFVRLADNDGMRGA